MSPSDVPFYEIRILCCELSKILFGVSCYQDGKLFLGGTMQDRESVFSVQLLTLIVNVGNPASFLKWSNSTTLKLGL